MSLSRKEIVIVLILAWLIAIEVLSLDLYLPAFSAIKEDLKTDMGKVQITISVFLAGFAVGQLLWGSLSDRVGRKLPIIAGSVIYTVSSLSVLWTDSIEGLWVCRFMQAFSGSAGVVISRAIVTDYFDRNRTANIFALLALVMGVGPIIAPMIGTLLLKQWSWQSNFTAMAFLGVISLLSVIFLLPETHPESKRQRTTNPTFKDRTVLGSYLHVFRNRQFLKYTLIGSLTYIGIILYISNSPFLIMEKGGFSGVSYSLIFGGNALGIMIASFSVTKLSKHFNLKLLVKMAIVVQTVVTALLFAAVLLDLSILYILVLVFLFLLTLGILFPTTTDLALKPFHNDSGTASALFGFAQLAITFLVTALIGLLQNHSILPMASALLFCALLSWVFTFIPQRRLNEK